MAKHCFEGGTGVTNFSSREREHYQQAIDTYGDPSLTISDDILTPEFNVPGEVLCLHDARQLSVSLSPFWRIFEALQKQEANNGD